MKEYKENEELSNAWHNYLMAKGKKEEKKLSPLPDRNASWPLMWVGLAVLILIVLGILLRQNLFPLFFWPPATATGSPAIFTTTPKVTETPVLSVVAVASSTLTATSGVSIASPPTLTSTPPTDTPTSSPTPTPTPTATATTPAASVPPPTETGIPPCDWSLETPATNLLPSDPHLEQWQPHSTLTWVAGRQFAPYEDSNKIFPDSTYSHDGKCSAKMTGGAFGVSVLPYESIPSGTSLVVSFWYFSETPTNLEVSLLENGVKEFAPRQSVQATNEWRQFIQPFCYTDWFGLKIAMLDKGTAWVDDFALEQADSCP